MACGTRSGEICVSRDVTIRGGPGPSCTLRVPLATLNIVAEVWRLCVQLRLAIAFFFVLEIENGFSTECY